MSKENDLIYIFKLLSFKKLRKAYKIICKINADKYIPHGFYNWKKAYKEGLAKGERKEYLKLYKQFQLPDVICAIYVLMSGESIFTTVKAYCKHYKPNEDIDSMIDRVKYITSYYSNEKELKTYEALGIEYYMFMATLDDRTCDKCGELDRKVFEVKNAVQGINCPPMHMGCRCTTVAWFDDQLKDKQRRARDPKTGKTYLIPASVNYKEWKNTYWNNE